MLRNVYIQGSSNEIESVVLFLFKLFQTHDTFAQLLKIVLIEEYSFFAQNVSCQITNKNCEGNYYKTWLVIKRHLTTMKLNKCKSSLKEIFVIRNLWFNIIYLV